jgi:regulatory protein
MSMNGRRKGPAAPRSAYETAVGLLARREQSRRELRDRLERKGYGAAESDAALDRLVAEHYQDDARFGAMLVRARVAQGYGPARLRAELGSHGLPDALIRELVAQADVVWFERARAQLRKHFPGAEATDGDGRARQAQYLLRRGFDGAIARRAVDRRVDDADDSGDNA